MNVNRKIVLLLFVFYSLAILIAFLSFFDIKNNIVATSVETSENIKKSLLRVVKENALRNNYEKIQNTFDAMYKDGTLNSIVLKNKHYLFSKDALVKKTNTMPISDVTVDYGVGRVNMLTNSLYEIIPNRRFNERLKINVKYQSLSSGFVLNNIARLYFHIKNHQKDVKYNTIFPSSIIKSKELINLEKNKTLVVSQDNYEYLEVIYNENLSGVYNAIDMVLLKILAYLLVVIVFTFIILLFIKNYLLDFLKKEYKEPVELLNHSLEQIIGGSFVQIKQKDFENERFSLMAKNIKNLSKKLSSISNELTVNQNIMQKKLLTDDLTGLPNREIFDIEIRNMFVKKSNAYLCTLMINDLMEYTKIHGSNRGNQLIKDFSSNIDTLLHTKGKNKATLYRFYGSDFAIILNDLDKKELENILKDIVQIIEKMQKKYALEYKLAHIGAIPFDFYGELDSILDDMHATHKIALHSPNLFYFIKDNSKVLAKAEALERAVKDIIDKKHIEIKMMFDTHELSINKTLLMQEVVPLIICPEKDKQLSIGVFVSVAEKLKIVSEFDKIIIEKAFLKIEEEKIEHYLAVNLSMDSIADRGFMIWLLEKIVHHGDLAKNIVFSITAYSVAKDIQLFKTFVTKVHKLNGKVILKRLQAHDFSEEKLEELNIDFIRIDKTYTTKIRHEHNKRSFIKSIILFGSMNNVTIYGDNIKNEEDRDAVEMLGLYATS